MSDGALATTPASPQELEALGVYALRYVKPGQTIGLGTGQAAAAFIRALGARGITVRGVPTSTASENLASEVGIEVVTLADCPRLDATFDGADEVSPRLDLIKGWGGALVREKVVAAASRLRIILVGAAKIVSRLGAHGRLPVEVLPFAAPFAIRRIAALGLKPVIRVDESGREFFTDNGNLIADCGVNHIKNPARLERELLEIPGVIGTGLFVQMADLVLVAESGGKIRTLRRNI
ncbi:MAG: ribose-5-phosphate isomerase RpiA [Candidatus Binatales bacterium]